MSRKLEYAVYKGDKFIDIGTLEELAKKLNVKKRTIQWYATPCNSRRNKGNKITVIKLEDEAITK